MEVLLEIHVWLMRDFPNSKAKGTKGKVIDTLLKDGEQED